MFTKFKHKTFWPRRYLKVETWTKYFLTLTCIRGKMCFDTLWMQQKYCSAYTGISAYCDVTSCAFKCSLNYKIHYNPNCKIPYAQSYLLLLFLWIAFQKLSTCFCHPSHSVTMIYTKYNVKRWKTEALVFHCKEKKKKDPETGCYKHLSPLP